MGRYALPLFLTQTFRHRSHPEAVIKAHRYTMHLFNSELHGQNWRRKGVAGVQSLMGVERHKSGYPHSHAVLGHGDVDLGAGELSWLRRSIRLTCEEEWGFAKLEVAKSAAHCNAYVSKYIVKDGEIYISQRLEALNTGQLSMLAARPPASTLATAVDPPAPRHGARERSESAPRAGRRAPSPMRIMMLA
jgi:hypothetical protein